MLSMGKLTISMAIFNSYVKLPEGKSFCFPTTVVTVVVSAPALGIPQLTFVSASSWAFCCACRCLIRCEPAGFSPEMEVDHGEEKHRSACDGNKNQVLGGPNHAHLRVSKQKMRHVQAMKLPKQQRSRKHWHIRHWVNRTASAGSVASDAAGLSPMPRVKIQKTMRIPTCLGKVV